MFAHVWLIPILYIAAMHVTITYKTGCVYGGNLTAILLPDEVIVSVPSKKVYREYR